MPPFFRIPLVKCQAKQFQSLSQQPNGHVLMQLGRISCTIAWGTALSILKEGCVVFFMREEAFSWETVLQFPLQKGPQSISESNFMSLRSLKYEELHVSKRIWWHTIRRGLRVSVSQFFFWNILPPWTWPQENQLSNSQITSSLPTIYHPWSAFGKQTSSKSGNSS